MIGEETTAGIERLLESPRWELMPFDSFGPQVEHVPDGHTVTITASPQKGVGPTVDLAVEAATERSLTVVPHIAARMVRDRDHLHDIGSALTDAGITDIFVPGGDVPEPQGEFASAVELLRALDELGFSFEEVGITGYPEGHPEIADGRLREAMIEKQPFATYIVTQICYDADAIIAWMASIRDNDVALPVFAGIPGVMNYQRLIGISARVVVGDSIRFIRKTDGIIDMIRRMIGSRGVYYPDELIDSLAEDADDRDLGLAGAHLYTFNRVAETNEWRERRLPDR